MKKNTIYIPENCFSIIFYLFDVYVAVVFTLNSIAWGSYRYSHTYTYITIHRDTSRLPCNVSLLGGQRNEKYKQPTLYLYDCCVYEMRDYICTMKGIVMWRHKDVLAMACWVRASLRLLHGKHFAREMLL